MGKLNIELTGNGDKCIRFFLKLQYLASKIPGKHGNLRVLVTESIRPAHGEDVTLYRIVRERL